MFILHETLPVGLVYCKKQFDKFFFGLWRHRHVKTPLWRHFTEKCRHSSQMSDVGNFCWTCIYFLCNLPIALAFLKIWSDKTKTFKEIWFEKICEKSKTNVLTSAKYSDCDWPKFLLVHKNHLIAFQWGVKHNSTIIFSTDITI